MSVRVIEDESHFQQELQAAGVRLVVVDFTATWLVCVWGFFISLHSTSFSIRLVRNLIVKLLLPGFKQVWSMSTNCSAF